MNEIIQQAVNEDMSATAVEGLQFINHVINQIEELEKTLSEQSDKTKTRRK